MCLYRDESLTPEDQQKLPEPQQPQQQQLRRSTRNSSAHQQQAHIMDFPRSGSRNDSRSPSPANSGNNNTNNNGTRGSSPARSSSPPSRHNSSGGGLGPAPTLGRGATGPLLPPLPGLPPTSLPFGLRGSSGSSSVTATSGVSPPPTLVPSSLSMASMASMLGHHPALAAAGGLPSFLHMPGYPRDLAAAAALASATGRSPASMDEFAKFMDRSFVGAMGGDSPPPPTAPTNDPTANECKIVEYRGEKIAAFIIGGRTMLCLPQAFELFLKHLVGGLHTVYTKLKRLEITPMVCNVEQVRILRGLGAIQPGVNRCKLLADVDFDQLYKDCTTSSSRPGRPPKRGVPFPPMSPQDAMLHLKQLNGGVGGPPPGTPGAHGGPGGLGSDPYGSSPHHKDGPFGKEPRLDKPPFGNGFGLPPTSAAGAPPPPPPPGLNPMAAQFMALNHPAAFLSASQAAAAGLSPFGLPGAGAGAGAPGALGAASPSLSGGSSGSPGSTADGPGGVPGSRPDPTQNLLAKASGLSSLEALQRSGLFGAASYLERMREGQRSLQEQQERALAEFSKNALAAGGMAGLKDPAGLKDVGALSTPLNANNKRDRSLSPDVSRISDGGSLDNGRRRSQENESPILNLTKPGDQPQSSLERHLRAAAAASASTNNNSKEPVHKKQILQGSDNLISENLHDDIAVADDSDSLEDSSNNKDKNANTSQNKDKQAQQLQNNSLAALAAAGGGLPNLLELAAQQQQQSGGGDANQLNSVYSIIGNIQALLKMAVENANKKEEKGEKIEASSKSSSSSTNEENNKQSSAADSSSEDLGDIEKIKRDYLRKLKKEKRQRRKIQEELEEEKKRRERVEEALRVTSAETLRRISESFSKNSENNSENSSKLRKSIDEESEDIDEDESETDESRKNSSSAPRTSSSPLLRSESPGSQGEGGLGRTGRLTGTVNAANADASDLSSPANGQNARHGAGAGSPPVTAPSIGFAKNLFPFNGSSLFTGAN